MATPKSHRLDSFVTGACGPDLSGALLAPLWLRTSVGLSSVLFQVSCLSLSSLPLQHQLCQWQIKDKKIPLLCHCKMATPNSHQLDSFVTKAWSIRGPFGPLWLCTSVGLTSILFQVTCLKPEQLATTTPALSLTDKSKKILHCATAKMATPNSHRLDSFVTGGLRPCSIRGPLGPLWLRTSVELTSVLFQVTCLKPEQLATTTPALSLTDKSKKNPPLCHCKDGCTKGPPPR